MTRSVHVPRQICVTSPSRSCQRCDRLLILAVHRCGQGETDDAVPRWCRGARWRSRLLAVIVRAVCEDTALEWCHCWRCGAARTTCRPCHKLSFPRKREFWYRVTARLRVGALPNALRGAQRGLSQRAPLFLTGTEVHPRSALMQRGECARTTTLRQGELTALRSCAYHPIFGKQRSYPYACPPIMSSSAGAVSGARRADRP
jgi:hypothetical protein